MLIPQLIEKSGHKSERHKLAFKNALCASSEVISSARLCTLLLQVIAMLLRI